MITTNVITSAIEMQCFEEDLTAFLSKYSSNPFLLYPFIKHIMLKSRASSSPLILVIKNDDEIVGLASLLLKKRFGFRVATSLHKYTGSPDIVIKDEYQREVIKTILFVLLEKMHCKSIMFTLPSESRNLDSLQEECKSNRIHFLKLIEEYMNHCVIPVNSSWTDYQKSLGGKYRRKIKQTENRLSNMGEWKIAITETTSNDQTAEETLHKIQQVEKISWKEAWRLQTGNTKDEDLEGIWKTSRILTKTNSDFKLMVWILELKNEPVATSLIMLHKGTAVIAKTSYACKLAKLSPGIAVNNTAIKDLFSKGEIQKIDFLTNLPFMKLWHPTNLPRVKFEIMSKDLFFVFYLIENSSIKRLLCRIYSNFFERRLSHK